MDQGVLIVPFGLVLAVLALFDSRIVLAIWSFTFLAMPTLRSKLGPVSVYWCDVAALLACFVCLRGAATVASRSMTKWYIGLAVVHLIGVLTSLLRYQAILEPGYEALRFGIAFLPLVLLPRIVDDDGAMDWFWHGVLASALWMAAVALIQYFWRDLALQFETFLYGPRSVGSVNLAYRERAIMENTRLRVHGMYGASTCFAGAASMTGALLMLRMSRIRAGLLTRLGVLGSAVAMLLTFSRHGLLAWGALLIPPILRRPGRGAILPVILVGSVAVLGAGQFWAERIGRGGVRDDENLSARLVDRPLELLDRISDEPSILLTGVGLGTSHIVRPDADAPSREGFVSNSFALYLFYLGVWGLGVVVALLFTALRVAWRLEGDVKGAALGGLTATVVVIASDNYGFLHSSFPFMWAVLVALIHGYANLDEPLREAEPRPEMALHAP